MEITSRRTAGLLQAQFKQETKEIRCLMLKGTELVLFAGRYLKYHKEVVLKFAAVINADKF